jgi:elongator complex protein 3
LFGKTTTTLIGTFKLVQVRWEGAEGSESFSKMATETITMEERQRKPKDANLPPENERFIRACSDIASFLVQEHESQQDPSKPKRDVNLNSLRSKMSKKHKLSNIPPLTAIIAAIPEHYKKYILPKLIAKPISMFLQ